MSNKAPPRVAFNFEPDPIEEDVNIETGESNPNFIYDDDIIDKMEQMMPNIIEREEIIEDNIFDSAPAPAPYPSPSKSKPAPAPAHSKPVKLTKKGRPRKPLSDEHRERLAENRKKALVAKKIKEEQTRQMKTQEKLEKEKQKALEAEEKELLKKKKQKDLDKLREELNDEKISSKPQPIPQNYFTKEDLERSQFEAIQKYEVLRKARKEEKKKEQMIQKQKDDMMSKINNYTYGARRPDGRLMNPYDRCY
jgi:hypothetical protein